MHAGNLAKLIAVLTLVSVLAHAGLAPAAISFTGHGIVSLAIGAGALFYFVFGAVSIVGMWLMRPWGFFSFYTHVILGTVLLGVSFLPFLPALLPPEARLWFVLGSNLVTLIVVGFVQWRAARERP